MTLEQDEDVEKYLHSPVHSAIVRKDCTSLKCILAGLPALPEAGEVLEEHESIAAEEKAEVVSSVIDRRDVPGRETPLHLAVKMGDKLSVEMLMAAGADWSLQNEQGWSALQEAVCAREEEIARIIIRYYQTLAWAKWCRRLPRITATMGRMRDFYMEISFNFESSVIPFISRIAPSDTYRIWKRGSNLRADMTLAGFDGFKIQRADQSFLFLGDGSEDGKHRPGSLLVLTHKDKEVTDALDGAGKPPTEAEIAQEVASMSRTNMYRPGIDVTQAELAPQLSWRRQEKTEMVGPWKAKVFDMNNVMVSVKSRRVPGAMSDEELFNAEDTERNEEDKLDAAAADLLTEEEKLQLEKALALDPSDINEETFENNCDEEEVRKGKNGLKSDQNGASSSSSSKDEKRGGWFLWSKKNKKHEQSKRNQSHTEVNGKEGSNPLSNGEALSQELKSVTNLASDSSRVSSESRRMSDSCDESMANGNKGKDAVGKRAGGGKTISTRKQMPSDSNGSIENEYKKGLKPVLWLTGDFPLKTEELLPLLDILANKVKAVRRLRELLTTKLPPGTFPAKIAIPVVPTIRVVVTFTKFEEWRSSEEFGTPLSSPAHFQEQKGNEVETPVEASSSSWLSWIRGQQNQASERDLEDELDPFSIPPDYTWVDINKKKKGMKANTSKAKRGKKPLNKASECGDSEAEESSGGGNML